MNVTVRTQSRSYKNKLVKTFLREKAELQFREKKISQIVTKI